MGLHKILREFPDQLETATREFAKLELPKAWAGVTSVVFCGMGGSAIGAELVRTLPAAMVRKPLSVVRDYELPAYVGPETLVVVVSYSGDTEEAVACFTEAKKRGCPLMVVTSGGKLAKLAREADTTLYQFTYQAPPRDALGFLFAPLPRVLEAAGVLSPGEGDLASAIGSLKGQQASLAPEAPSAKNPAKHLAYQLLDHVPLVIGTEVTSGVARRWKNQFNEHAKSASFSEVLPEADHNMVEGFTFPVRFRDDVVVVTLRTSFDQPDVARRVGLLKDYLHKQHVACEEITAPKGDVWAERLCLVALGDWASYYLALLNHTDPSAIPAITELKAKLRA